MDILTQGLIGAGVSQSVARREHVVKASLVGFVAGLLADADVLIRSSSDPLLSLEYHRHFTHAIFFIPFGALIAFALLWPLFRKHLSNRHLYLYCLSGFLFSGFIDACTSYGTHLLWPFSDTRIAWSIISIIDPVFTGILLITIMIGLKTRKQVFVRVGIACCAAYLMLGVMQQQRAETAIHALAQQRGHEIEKIIVKPTIGNILLWRSVYLDDDRFYIDAARAGRIVTIFEGDGITRFDPGTMAIDPGSTLANDIARFDHFSDGYVVHYPNRPDVLGDIRYSMTPLGIEPLWGITLYPDKPDRDVDYRFYRESDKAARQEFIDMLLNRVNN